MKGCICHFAKWQIHPFISKGTNKYVNCQNMSATSWHPHPLQFPTCSVFLWSTHLFAFFIFIWVCSPQVSSLCYFYTAHTSLLDMLMIVVIVRPRVNMCSTSGIYDHETRRFRICTSVCSYTPHVITCLMCVRR